MLREYLTNKWVLSAIGFLIVFSVVCVLWYRYDIAPDKQQLAKEEEMLRQREASQKTETDTETNESTDQISEKSNPTSREKQKTDNTSMVSSIEKVTPIGKTQEETITIEGREIRISDIPKVPEVSEQGFGEFPDVPEDYNEVVVWLQIDYYDLPPEAQKAFELLDRVLIKLWSEGKKNFKGGQYDTQNGKVYPNYFDTVYITVEDLASTDGNVSQYITHQVGSVPDGVDPLNPPSNITVLDYESSGIDPFQYLDLPHK